MTVTVQDKVDLIRLVGLIGRHRPVLSVFEAELAEECVGRFRRLGDQMTLTPNERLVLCDALLALDKADAEATSADYEAAAGMRGAA